MLLKFIHTAVWESHLEREPCVEGKCFILFQIDMVEILQSRLSRETHFSFFVCRMVLERAVMDEILNNKIHIDFAGDLMG